MEETALNSECEAKSNDKILDAVDTKADTDNSVQKESEPIAESSHLPNEPVRNVADYEEIAREDLETLKREFPELSEAESILEIENPLRYAALRDLGLSPAEAYRATTKSRRKTDNRFHLGISVPRAASMPQGAMSEAELKAAREIFSDISDSEIRNLYKRVTQ